MAGDTSASVMSRISPLPSPVWRMSCTARLTPASGKLPRLGMMSVDRLETSAAIVRVSSVSGVTVNAWAENTTSPV